MKLELNFKSVVEFVRVYIFKRPKEGEIWFVKRLLDGRHFSVREYGKVERVAIVQVTPSVITVTGNSKAYPEFVERKHIKFLSRVI
jgi:hypothetical protein